jgi:ATP-dependent helicase/nuclease subunit B
MQVLLARLERATRPVVDGLCRELSASGYKPVFFELRIKSGAQGSPEPVIIKSDERRIFVYGTIDRVDAFVDEGDVYVRVVDYKTGTKVFSPSDLAEGKNLQMFLYLRAIVDTENSGFKVALGGAPDSKLLPGGVIYAHTAISDATVTSQSPDVERAAIDEKQKRAGMVLDDERSISAMSREHLPLTFDRSGNISSTDRLYTIDGWQKISETVEESVRRVADGITHGRAEAPKKDRKNSPCDYCDFKSVCRNATMK